MSRLIPIGSPAMATLLLSALSGGAEAQPPALAAPAAAAAAAPSTAGVPRTLAAPQSTGLPAFEPGLWEYRRKVQSSANPKPTVSSVKKCSDPSLEIQRKLAELRQKGCQFGPVSVQGNRYTSSWRCPSNGGVLMVHNVVTVTSATGYQDDNEVHLGERITRSSVLATREGACPNDSPPPSLMERPSPPGHAPAPPKER